MFVSSAPGVKTNHPRSPSHLPQLARPISYDACAAECFVIFIGQFYPHHAMDFFEVAVTVKGFLNGIFVACKLSQSSC